MLRLWRKLNRILKVLTNRSTKQGDEILGKTWTYHERTIRGEDILTNKLIKKKKERKCFHTYSQMNIYFIWKTFHYVRFPLFSILLL